MRLTKWKEYETNKRLYRSNKEVSIGDLVWKLGKLEDIEEELGIDLITLFKALKNGVYLKDKYNAFEDNGDKWFITELENDCGFYKKQLHICQFMKRKPNGLFGDDEYCPPEEHKKAVATWRSTVIYLKDYRKTWALRKEDLE